MGARHFRKGIASFSIFALLGLMTFVLAGCGGTSSSAGMGSANVTLSDPPVNTDYTHIWVTVEDVSANISATSNSGWTTLTSNLGKQNDGSVNAVQLDLMNLPENGKCLLAQLGSTKSLPAGDYQQIRLMLVPNNATNVNLVSYNSAEPTTNQCPTSPTNSWNCVQPNGGSLTALNLASEAQTGLKIPPGQVMGGPIHVSSGQSVDLNIDFAGDHSVVAEGNGQYLLSPVLLAYQTSKNLTGISGQVVTGTVASGGTTVTPGTTGVQDAFVALEMGQKVTDASGASTTIDLIGNYLRQTDSSGNFDFCPLPAGPFDIVASAGSNAATTDYGATILTGVPNGAQVTVPLVSSGGSTANSAANLQGDVTATSSSSPITADVYALQQTTGGLGFAVPLLTGSTPSISQLSLTCTSGNCSTASSPSYSLYLPPNNPVVASYSSSGVTWNAPAASPFDYSVEATCTGSSGTLGVNSGTQTVSVGSTANLASLTLPTGCQ